MVNNNSNSNNENENVEEVPVSPQFQIYSTLPNAHKKNYLKSLPNIQKKALEEELKKFTLPVVKLKLPPGIPGYSGGRRTRKAKRHHKKRKHTRKH
jgi:hypothetical protein